MGIIRKKRRLVKCTLCRRVGHNYQTCPERMTEGEKQAALSRISENPASLRSKALIPVQTSGGKITSPHFLDLRGEQDSFWQQIETYKEKKTGKIESRTADFASMIREDRIKKEKSEENEKKEFPAEKPVISSYQQTRPKNLNTYPSWREKFKHWDFRRRIPVVSGKRNKVAVVAMAFLLLVAIVPFPAVGYYQKIKSDSYKIISESANAFLSLQSSTVAALSSDIEQAKTDLDKAVASFETAGNILDKEHHALFYVAGLLPVVGNEVLGRQRLLTAGHHLAIGNRYLVRGLSEINQNQSEILPKIKTLRGYLSAALPQYRAAVEDLGGVKAEMLPTEYQKSFDEFKLLFGSFIDDLSDLSQLSGAVEWLFGAQKPQRYLLVYQNNHELRPTGGFAGSFTIAEWSQGKMTRLETPGGGSYDLQGQLGVQVKPPVPLQIMNKKWEFQDGNWFPDFAASAEKMIWFYEHSRPEKVDGVIAINATVLDRLISVLGVIESDNNGLILADGDDAIKRLQYEVEVNYDKEKNRPKEVIGELLLDSVAKLNSLEESKIIALLSELHDCLEKKEIQVYFKDETVQNEWRDFGWTGEILDTQEKQDYVFVNVANVAGGKSDKKIQQQIEHQAVVQSDGTVLATVFVKRTHTGKAGEEFYGRANLSYLRLYVPLGSELISAGGFSFPDEDIFKAPEKWYGMDADLERNEKQISTHVGSGTRITEEFSKTAFGNWILTMPGKSSEVFFTYKLPFKIFDKAIEQNWLAGWKSKIKPASSSYSLLAQKQSGIDSAFSSSVIYPDGWLPSWRSDENVGLARNGFVFEKTLDRDLIFGAVMEK